ncbi:MAG TPA: pantoate--beta-alanine ligase [Candidatus Nanopelagicales bacterium]|nr:pantoate--beta-alanine ligase [Candidatus Nanopelagicales bacterium]
MIGKPGAAARGTPGAPAGRPLVVRTRAELAAALARAPRPLGLVPTMGWLHAGHRSLIARARAESATVAVSIFVNPRQFSSPADLDRYPRNEARDLAICAEEGVDLVWAPGVDDVFPAGFDTSVQVGAVSGPLEGAARPGHFEGVATVVAVLLGLARPDRAYFGMKDAQQLRVIARMATDLALATVVPCPTVREPDGLAMSSRNVHLAPAERAAAAVLYRALQAGRARRDTGERDAEAIRAAVREVLAAEPLAAVEYVSLADDVTLAELQRVDGPALLSLAVRFGTTRLIDNVAL